jgi:hypothetical protein
VNVRCAQQLPTTLARAIADASPLPEGRSSPGLLVAGRYAALTG